MIDLAMLAVEIKIIIVLDDPNFQSIVIARESKFHL